MGSKRVRLDVALVQRQLASDSKQAQAYIISGKTIVNDQRQLKCDFSVSESDQIRIRGLRKYVGRGGEKLQSAVSHLGVECIFKDAIVLDIGASTGGFSDFALQAGAREVICLDVGSNQLAWELRNNTKIKVMEKTDIRDVSQFCAANIVLADISFNSLAQLAPAIANSTTVNDAHFILLIKPQFELPAEEVPSGGVVENPESLQSANQSALTELEKCGLGGGVLVPSAIKGRAGNQETFYFVRRNSETILA